MRYNLKDLCEIKYGKNQKKVEDPNGKVPIFGTGGLMGYANQYLYSKPSVLIPRKGSISKVAFSNLPFWTVDTLFYTIVNEEIVLPKYLYYVLSRIDLNRYNEGTTIPSLRTETLNRIELDIPELAEQKQVVKVMDILEEKINANQEIIHKMESFSYLLFNRWFAEFEFPNENGQPYKSSGGEMVDSELGIIPRGWSILSIDALSNDIIDHRGKTPKKLGGEWSSKGYPAISAKNIKNNRIIREADIRYLSGELYSKWMKKELEYGDIIMTSEAPLGEMYFVNEGEKYGLSQRLFAIRINKDYFIPSVFFSLLNHDKYKELILNRATGTTVTGIRQSELRKVRLIVPPMNIQKKIAGTLSASLEQQYIIRKENSSLVNLRNILLPKLLSGEIDVPEEIETI